MERSKIRKELSPSLDNGSPQNEVISSQGTSSVCQDARSKSGRGRGWRRQKKPDQQLYVPGALRKQKTKKDTKEKKNNFESVNNSVVEILSNTNDTNTDGITHDKPNESNLKSEICADPQNKSASQSCVILNSNPCTHEGYLNEPHSIAIANTEDISMSMTSPSRKTTRNKNITISKDVDKEQCMLLHGDDIVEDKSSTGLNLTSTNGSTKVKCTQSINNKTDFRKIDNRSKIINCDENNTHSSFEPEKLKLGDLNVLDLEGGVSKQCSDSFSEISNNPELSKDLLDNTVENRQPKIQSCITKTKENDNDGNENVTANICGASSDGLSINSLHISSSLPSSKEEDTKATSEGKDQDKNKSIISNEDGTEFNLSTKLQENDQKSTHLDLNSKGSRNIYSSKDSTDLDKDSPQLDVCKDSTKLDLSKHIIHSHPSKDTAQLLGPSTKDTTRHLESTREIPDSENLSEEKNETQSKDETKDVAKSAGCDGDLHSNVLDTACSSSSPKDTAHLKIKEETSVELKDQSIEENESEPKRCLEDTKSKLEKTANKLEKPKKKHKNKSQPESKEEKKNKKIRKEQTNATSSKDVKEVKAKSRRKKDKTEAKVKNQCQNKEDDNTLDDGCVEDVEEEDSWFSKFDEDGECLDPDLKKELSEATDIKNPTKYKTQFDFYSLPAKGIQLDEGFGHIVEIYDFSPELKTQDLTKALAIFKDQNYEIKWVDDTHALAAFSSSLAANQAIQLCSSPLLKLRPISQGIPESKNKAKRCFEFLQPQSNKPRPVTTTLAANRLVTGALGVRSSMTKEERQKEREKLNEARELKRQEKQRKADVWGE